MRCNESVEWARITRAGEWYVKSNKNHRAPAIAFGALLFVYLCAVAPAVFAQSDGDRYRDLEQKLDQALRIIQDLVPRLDRLEKQNSQTQASSAENKTAAAAQPAMADPGILLPLLGTPLHGFADVGGVAGSDRKGKLRGFTVGSFDLYLAPEIGDNVKSLIETLFEVDSEGQIAVDLERAQVGYTFGDYLTAWLGRFHTPYGYWNTAFHHGQQISTSVRRPQFIDFEDKGGILPAHTVGVWGTGSYNLGGGKLSYDLFLGNAPKLQDGVLNMNMAGLKRFTPSYGTNVGYAFRGALDGVKLGLHWLRGDVQNVNLNTKTTLNAVGPYLLYTDDPWEIISELYRFDNKDVSGKTGLHGSWAGFAQLARNFDRWTPYTRFEWTDLNQRDPYFRDMESGRSYTRGVFGIRYDLSSKAALKLEYRHTVNKNQPGREASGDAVETQFAVRF